MPTAVGEQENLTDQIMAGLERSFLQYGHRPSPAHWKGLRAIAKTIEAQASGTAAPNFFLSALPTGMGKTTAMVESVKALVSRPDYADVGVAIFVGQLDQIRRLVDEMELAEDVYSVRTGVENVELNALGRTDHGNAQVLFTTQQKLPHLLRYQKNFPDIPFFKFQGTPRRVRIWDEAILPAEPLTFTVKQFEEAAVLLRELGQYSASALLVDWISKKLPLFYGSVVEMPLLILELGWGNLDKLEKVANLSNLIWMSGQDVRLHEDDFSGATTISYRESLPREFAPLLVLDASGSLRLTYELWEKGRGNLIELVSPGKTYTNLTIHHWDQAAGKHAQQDPTKAEILAQGVAAAINETPSDEQVLIIVRKQDDLSDPSLEQSILEKVGRNRERSTLHFLTWGRHTATNEFADVKHVIVVGALQYSYAQNEALARAAEGLSVYASVTDDKVDRMRLGEIAHHLFQAVGRGAVRKSMEGDCPPGCHLWIAVSSVGKAPIPTELLKNTFRGARWQPWTPVKPALKKSQAAVVKAVEFHLADNEQVTVTVGEIANHAGYSWNTVVRRLKEQRVYEELRGRAIEAKAPDQMSPKGAVRLSRFDNQ